MNKISSVFMFRFLTSLIFIYAGAKHVLDAEKILARVQQTKLYALLNNNALYLIVVQLSGYMMIVAAIFLIAGKYQDKAASILLIILACITLTVQLENLNDLGPFFKNVAIGGSLIFIIKNHKHDYKTNSTIYVHAGNKHGIDSTGKNA